MEFDLRVFACEHIGLSKKCHNGELKRVLRPAINELESRGFLHIASDEERFVQKARGEWSIVLSRASKNAAEMIEVSPLVQSLIERGISANTANKLTRAVSAEKIQEKLGLVDWLSARNDARVQKNKAGFLYRAITDDFALPDDYRKAVGDKKRQVAAVVPIRRIAPKPEERRSTTADRQPLEKFWNSIPSEEQQRIEAELLKTAPPFLRQQYVEGQKERGLLFRTVRQAIIDDYVRNELSKAGTSEPALVTADSD